MAARKRRGVTSLPENWKEKIKAGVIAHRFEKCFNGEIELTPIQLKAGEILFKRLEPELSRTEHAGHDGKEVKTHMTVEFIGSNENPDTN